MQTIISVLKAALAIRRRTFVTEAGESRGISIIRSTVRAKKFFIKDLINDGQATDRKEFNTQAGNIEKHCTQDIQRRLTCSCMTEVVQGECRTCCSRRSASCLDVNFDVVK